MPNIKPFLPSRPSGPTFLFLNAVRVLSIIALLLVLAANIVTMVDDIKAIKATTTTTTTSDSASDPTWDCDYIEYSSVPDQAGGAFWSILNRIFIVFECILLTLSEVGVPRKMFEEYLPVLGPAYGPGTLGVVQALIGAQVLSHYCDLFPQVSSWLLFIVGCINILVGIFLRSGAKQKRLIFSWENVSSLTPQTRMAATAWDMITEKKSSPSSTSASAPAPAAAAAAAAAPTLSRTATNASDTPLLPNRTATEPGVRFGGFGFGRQGEKAAAERGWKISKPSEVLPRYAI